MTGGCADARATGSRRTQQRVLRLLLLGLLAGGTTGCALFQVDQLIDDSNAAIISAVLTRGLVEVDVEGKGPADPARAQELQAAVDEINAFIQENPAKPRIVNALQVRKGIMLLSAGSPNLARAAFAAVPDCGDLSSQRDRAICDIHEPLIWWQSVARRQLVPSDFSAADEHLETLAAAGNAIDPVDGRPPTIRYRVEQLRVRIALRVARPGGSKSAGYLRDGLTRYGEQFDAVDQAQLRSLCAKDFAAVDAFAVAWLGYVPVAFEEGAESWKESAMQESAPPLPGWWNEMEVCHANG